MAPKQNKKKLTQEDTPGLSHHPRPEEGLCQQPGGHHEKTQGPGPAAGCLGCAGYRRLWGSPRLQGAVLSTGEGGTERSKPRGDAVLSTEVTRIPVSTWGAELKADTPMHTGWDGSCVILGCGGRGEVLTFLPHP